MKGSITICDLEVFYRVGVPEEERSKPQRLLITIELELGFERCTVTDEVADTINYFQVSRLVLDFGKEKTWKTIEKLAADLAGAILKQFGPERATLEVKKFIIPETKYVSVKLSRVRSEL